MTLTQDQLARFQVELETERDRIASSIGDLNDEMVTGGTDDREGDVNSDASAAAEAIVVRERAMLVADNEQRLLAEIEAALTRIQEGTYGACVTCEIQIPVERLEAMPWAERCIEHADAG